jgi:hypothetical protein
MIIPHRVHLHAEVAVQPSATIVMTAIGSTCGRHPDTRTNLAQNWMMSDGRKANAGGE